MRWLGLVCFVLGLAACQSRPNSAQTIIYKPKYAKGFQISIQNQDTLLDLLNEKGEITESVSLSAKPKRIASLSTTCFYFLKELDALSLLVGQGYLDRIHDEVIPTLTAQNLSENGDLVKERIMGIQPDMILAIPFDRQNWKELFPRATVINVAEYLEEHPLGRTEWLVALGYALHKSEEGKKQFESIEQAYHAERINETSAVAKNVVFATDNGSDFTVAPKNSFWYILFSDAGGNYLGPESKGNQNQQIEGMLSYLHQADYYGELVYQPESETIDLVTKRKVFQSTPPFQRGQLFYSNSAINQFFDKGVMEPHVMLRDLRAILENNLTHEGVYFKRN